MAIACTADGLVAGEGERQRFDDLAEVRIGDADRGGRELVAGPSSLREPELEGEELVERQAVQCRLRLRLGLGEVGGLECLGEGREIAAFRIGQRVLQGRKGRLQDSCEQLAQPLLGHAGGEWIDRNDARGVDRVASDRAELG